MTSIRPQPVRGYPQSWYAVVAGIDGVQVAAEDEPGYFTVSAAAGSEAARPDEPVVLLVDDDPGIRHALSMVLDDVGVYCLSAADGAGALELLGKLERLPDLIFLDLMMPIMNGVDFRRAQLADPRLCRIPTVVVSAVGETVKQLAELHLTEVLRKPVDIDVLLAAVERHVPGWQPED